MKHCRSGNIVKRNWRNYAPIPALKGGFCADPKKRSRSRTNLLRSGGAFHERDLGDVDAAAAEAALAIDEVIASQLMEGVVEAVGQAIAIDRFIVAGPPALQRRRPTGGSIGGVWASKAALEPLVLANGDEVKNLAPLKVEIVDPGGTAAAMRARAYPGEDLATLKHPRAVAEALIELLNGDFETGTRLKVISRAVVKVRCGTSNAAVAQALHPSFWIMVLYA